MKLFIFILCLIPALSYANEPLSEDSEVSTVQTRDHNFNFKVNALGIIFGLGDLSLEYRLHPNFTVSGSLLFGAFTQKSSNDQFEFDIRTFGGNLKGTYYFSEAYKDSFYLSALAGTLDFDVTLDSDTIDASSEFSSSYIGAAVGYAWHWKHFNASIGAGYNHSFADKDAEIKINNIVGTTSIRVHFNLILEASVGLTF